MTNGGDTPLAGLLSGQTLWPSAGYFFGVPGLGDLQEGQSTGALADRAVAYDEDWSITLHAPYLDFVGSRSKDLFLQHTLQPGESRTFDAWLQVGARGDLGPVVAAEIERGHLPAGTLRGSVQRSRRQAGARARRRRRRSKARRTRGASVTTVVTTCRCRPATTRSTRRAKGIRRASRCP